MKKFLEKLSRKIGFTPNEGKIVLVLVGAFLVGSILSLSGVSNKQRELIDYSASDSEFVQKSRIIQQPMKVQNTVKENNATDTIPDTVTDKAETVTKQSKKPDLPQSPLDINTATKDELMSLPGIGDAMAERIIMYREDDGRFTTPDDLLKIKGIGKKKLERITPYIKVK